MSTPAAAVPARAMSQSASRVKTISCPLARVIRMTTALTRRAPLVMTSAPRAGVILVEASFKQIVHVAAETPARIAKRTARLTRRGPAGARAAGDGRSASLGRPWALHLTTRRGRLSIRGGLREALGPVVGAPHQDQRQPAPQDVNQERPVQVVADREVEEGEQVDEQSQRLVDRQHDDRSQA